MLQALHSRGSLQPLGAFSKLKSDDARREEGRKLSCSARAGPAPEIPRNAPFIRAVSKIKDQGNFAVAESGTLLHFERVGTLMGSFL